MSGYRSDGNPYSECKVHTHEQTAYQPDRDATLSLLTGFLACTLVVLALWSIGLSVMLFGSTILAALQGAAAAHINVLAMTSLNIGTGLLWGLLISMKAEQWGEKMIASELENKRHATALFAQKRERKPGVRTS